MELYAALHSEKTRAATLSQNGINFTFLKEPIHIGSVVVDDRLPFFFPFAFYSALTAGLASYLLIFCCFSVYMPLNLVDGRTKSLMSVLFLISCDGALHPYFLMIH